MAWGLLVLLCGCHARLSDAPTDDIVIDAPSTDATDAAPDALILGKWGTPQPIAAAATAAAEDDCTMSSTTLELYFAIADVNGNKDLYVSTRNTTADPFGAATKLAFDVTGTTSEETPRLSADDLTLYFASNRTGTKGGLDIWYVKRSMVGAAWGPPVNLSEVNTTASEKWFQPCGTAGRYMIVVSNGANGNDLAEGVLGSGTAAVVAPTLNSTASETGTFLTQDCLTIFFASSRGATTMMYTSQRNAVTDAWPPPTAVTDFSATGGNQQDPWMSADQRTFIFASDAAGNNDVYISTR
jgi:hypothetical protein